MLGFYLLIYWLCLIFYLALKDNASLLQLKAILLPQILNRAQNVYQSTARNSPDKCKMSLSMSTTVTSCFRNDFLSWTVSLSIYLHDSVDSKTMKIRPRLRRNQNYHLQFQSSSAPGKKKSLIRRKWSGSACSEYVHFANSQPSLKCSSEDQMTSPPYLMQISSRIHYTARAISTSRAEQGPLTLTPNLSYTVYFHSHSG